MHTSWCPLHLESTATQWTATSSRRGITADFSLTIPTEHKETTHNVHGRGLIDSDESRVPDDLFANGQFDRATAASGFLSPKTLAPPALGQLGPTIASAQGAAESTHGEAINTETTDADLDTSEELAEFNLRILKLNQFLSKSREWTLLSPLPVPMSTLADEMMAMTRCLLGIMKRYTLSLHHRHHRRNQPSAFLSSNISRYLYRTKITFSLNLNPIK
ncbi:hypothetical protein DL771_007643 [Monosporascus sp. 5C6A]|nr:hypothetical protein DL771_007643 [Monosporascus sp. 5C6A]